MGGAPRVIFFGMDSEFSTRPLLALLRSGVQVKAVVKPVGGIALRRTNMATRVPSLMTRLREQWQRLVTPPTPLDGEPPPDDPFLIAETHRIPCYLVGDASGERSLRLLRKYDVDLFCVAFFNQLLRPACLALPHLGSVNLHPSLLPAYRGPSPLFWTFKDAVRETGVTLHLLHPGEDDGDIVGQVRVPLPDGMRGPELLHQLAVQGASLMAKGVWDLFHGEAKPLAQDPARAFRSPRPEQKDLRVDFNRPAREVFNFVRGVSMWVPLYAEMGHDRVDVVDAQGFQSGVSLGHDYVLLGNTALVQCADGTVELRVRPRPWPFTSVPAAVQQEG